MMVKKVLSFILVVLLSSQLFAAGKTEDPAQGKTELSIIWWGSQNRHDRTMKAIDLYMKKNPEVEITYEFAGWGDYWTKVTTMAAGGMLPDIMQQDYAKISEWESKGLLMPMERFIKSGVLDFSDVPESALAGGRINGDLYGVNLGMNSQCMVLDMDAFEKSGIPIPNENWTWEEFDVIVNELHNKLGIYGMGDGMLDDQLWKSLYLSNGEYVYAEDGKSLGYTDDSILINYSKMVLDWMNNGIAPDRETEVAIYHNKGVEAKAMVNGDSAIEYMWSNQIVAMNNAAGEGRNFYMTHIPRLTTNGPSANYLKPSMLFAISAKSKAAEEAAMFINYFTNDIDANKILLAERGVPISAHVRSGLKDLLDPASIVAFEFIDRVAKNNSPLPKPDPEGHSNIIQNIFLPEFVDPMAFGVVTVEEAVSTLRTGAEKILAEN